MESTSSTSEVELKSTSTETAAASTEELREHILEVTTLEPAALLSRTHFEALLAVLVIHLAFFRVLQRLIRVNDLLELLLRFFLVALVLVRVILNRKFLKSLSDFLVACRTLHTEDLVVVFST